MPPFVRSTLIHALHERDDEYLAALLRRRPDLALPPPSSTAALAARAVTRSSVERALATLTKFQLQVLEAIAVLPAPASSTQIRAAFGRSGTSATVRDAMTQLLDLALILGSTRGAYALPEVVAALGPYPAGLGPPLERTLAKLPAERLAALVVDLQIAPPTTAGDWGTEGQIAAVVDHLNDAQRVAELLAGAPDRVRRLLEALLWGPPVGQVSDADESVRTADASSPVQWLLARGLLSVASPQHVVLPREIALILRSGITHRDVQDSPPDLANVPVAAAEPGLYPTIGSVDATAADSALELVHHVGALLTHWDLSPAPALRTGGVGVRELRRVARALQTDETPAALVIEIAAAAGLIASDTTGSTWVPSRESDEPAWLQATDTQRWAYLAASWLRTTRTAWLVGARDDRGALRSALDPDLERPWAPRLRRAVLAAVAQLPPDAADPAGAVHNYLRWLTPRTPPHPDAVSAVLREAELVGITGSGALSSAGAALLPVTGASDAAAAEQIVAQAADALAAALPPAVGEMLLQADLTAVVPGRPTTELAGWLGQCAQLEQRGSAYVYRFSSESIREAISAGRSADELLGLLAAASKVPVPQALTYLIKDAERRHGQIRVAPVSATLRATDTALLAGLVSDPAYAHLGLHLAAPTVLTATAAPNEVLEALRNHGHAPVAEAPDGSTLAGRPRRLRPPSRASSRGRGPADVILDAATTQRTIAHIRAGDVAQQQLLTRDTEGHRHGDPLVLQGTLAQAEQSGQELALTVVDGQGVPRRRRVRVTKVVDGRARVIDLDRETELVVQIHRVLAAVPHPTT